MKTMINTRGCCLPGENRETVENGDYHLSLVFPQTNPRVAPVISRLNHGVDMALYREMAKSFVVCLDRVFGRELWVHVGVCGDDNGQQLVYALPNCSRNTW